MKIKAVCFDLGGVLVRIGSDWNSVAQRAGIKIAEGHGSFSTSRAFEKYQIGLTSDNEYEVGLQAEFQILPNESRILHNAILEEEYEGIPELVQMLVQRDVRVGCLSNTNSLHWERLCNQELFPTIASLPIKVASHEAKCCKPQHEIYELFESLVGASEREIVYFDDSPQYVEAATQLGWRAFCIDRLRNPAIQMAQHLQGLL